MALNVRVGLLGFLVLGGVACPSLLTGQPCGAWSYGSSSPQGYAVAAGAGTMVIVMPGGVLASHGGAAWRWAAVTEFNRWTRVAWGSGRFAAIASTAILVSEDGLAWRQVATLPQPAPTDIASNGSAFVAVGRYFVSTSPDGLLWQTRPIGFDLIIETVRWAGSQWIGMGLRGLYTSADGVEWTQRGPDIYFKSVAWNGSQYLAFGNDITGDTKEVIATSQDGVAWTVRATGGLGMSDLASDGNQWVASAYGAVLVSADGLNWRRVDFEANLQLLRVVWTGTAFVAVGRGGIATSAEGSSWTPQPVVDLTTATWTGSRFVALGGLQDAPQGAAFVSFDGSTWFGAATPPDTTVYGVVSTGSRLVAVGSSGGIFVSADGDIWEREASGAVGFTDLTGVTWNGSQLVAVGFGGQIFTSPDGETWTEVARLDGLAYGVTWGNGLFVAVGTRSDETSSCLAIWTSPDGVRWANQNNGALCGPIGQCTFSLSGVTASETRFVAVGGSLCLSEQPQKPTFAAMILTSTDGVHWSPADLSQIPADAPWVRSIAWTSVGFVGTSDGGLIASPDGLTWKPDPQFVGHAAAVTGDGRGLVAVGKFGSTARTDCAAPPPFGQPGMTSAAIVTAARTPGLRGTRWISDLELFNSTPDAMQAVIYYLPREADNSTPVRRSVMVPAGQAVRLGDVVGQLFGVANSAGALAVSSVRPLLVSSRTYTTSDDGTLGQFVPGLGDGAALATGDAARLIHLTRNPAYRTNIGFESITSWPISVTVDLFQATGEFLGTRTFALQPFGSAQATEIFPQIGVDVVGDAFAVVRSDTAGAKFFTYAAVVDNISGDSITVLSGRVGTGEPLYVPAVAHNPGLKGTQWRADLEVHNPGAVQAHYTLELLKAGQDNSAPSSAAFTLDPGMSRRYVDVVKDVFGFEGSGAIRVTPSAGSIMVAARSYTDSSNGTRGQFIPGFPASAATAANVNARLIQLTQTATGGAGFRTNIGLVNVTATRLSVQIALYSAQGAWLGTRVLSLAPYEFRQETEILRSVTFSDVGDGVAVVSSATPEARFLAYASVVDNLSGDPIYIPAQ